MRTRFMLHFKKTISFIAVSGFFVSQTGSAQLAFQGPVDVGGTELVPSKPVEGEESPSDSGPTHEMTTSDFLASATTLQPAETETEAFADDFNRSELGSDWTSLGGRFGIGNGTLLAYNSYPMHQAGVLLNEVLGSDDYAVEADIYHGSAITAKGFLVRYEDAQHYYYVKVDKWGRSWVGKNDGGVWSWSNVMSTGWPVQNGWNRYKVEVEGNEFRFYREGELKWTYQDTNNPLLTGGQVGIYTDLYYERFDNFRVTVTDGSVVPGEVPVPVVNELPMYTNESTVVLSGTKSAGTSIWVNGVEVLGIDAETEWTVSYALTGEGLHALSVTARDAYGNESEAAEVETTLDQTAPEVVVRSSSISDGAAYTLVYEVDGIEKTRAETLVDGANVLAITETDLAGNETYLEFIVTYEDRPENRLIAGALMADATLQSASIDWLIEGDLDHDAVSTVRYRKSGDTAWKDQLGLFRIDYNENKFSGSLLDLAPGTSYEVEVTIADPDGGRETRYLTLKTRKVPVRPDDGRMIHVNSSGGTAGDGSLANPYGQIYLATRAAQPGDTILIHAGSYPQVNFDKAGAPDNYIVYRAAGDGPVLFPNGLEVRASHVWVEGLTVYGDDIGEGIVIRSDTAHEDVVILGNRVEQVMYGIRLKGIGVPPSRNYYIADNVVVGMTPAYKDTIRGEGIEIENLGTGHVIAYNRVSNIADGISYPGPNSDVYGNDIFDTRDDGIEMDYAGSNVRIHDNLIRNTENNSLSFQPQAGAPWYIYRNQIIGYREAPIKFRTTDRFLFANNTIVGYTTLSGADFSGMHQYLRSFSRNNLWLSYQGGEMYDFSPPKRETSSADWRTDIDYNGFDWGNDTKPFSYEGVYYPDLQSFSAATGIDVHGIVLNGSDYSEIIFPGPNEFIPMQNVTLTETSRAIDAGAVLPGINDHYTGDAPDLGAIEFGSVLPVYGPRIPVPDQLGAFISGISVSAQSTNVTVTWETDVPARSIIDYGTTDSYGKTATAAVLTTDHSITLTGLLPNTVYHFRVRSEDADGYTQRTEDLVFQTKSA